MVLSFLWIVTLTAPLIALMLSAGCAALPKPVSETRFVTTAPNATATEVPPDVAGQYWKRDQSREIKFGPAGIVSIIERAGPPDEELAKGRRVAITEFSVEFVEVQFQNPFGHPTMIKSSPAQVPAPSPVSPGMEPSGVGTKLTTMSIADQIHTSQAIRDVFEQILKEYGLIIVPQNTVTACAGYAKLKPSPSISSSWAHFLKSVPTDTGVVLRTHTVAAPGLGIATCGSFGVGVCRVRDQARDRRRCRDGRKTSRRHLSSEGRSGTRQHHPMDGGKQFDHLDRSKIPRVGR